MRTVKEGAMPINALLLQASYVAVHAATSWLSRYLLSLVALPGPFPSTFFNAALFFIFFMAC